MRPSRQFELKGGALCLDFADTIDDRGRPEPIELLGDCDDLIAFGRQTGILTAANARRTQSHPVQDRALLARARTLRDALYQLFATLAAGKAAPRHVLGVIQRELARLSPQVALTPTATRFIWQWSGPPASLERLLWAVLHSALDLLTSGGYRRVRVCESRTCAWLFLDTTRNHSRRWCDMTVCGNRAKARRYYKRHRRNSA
jgi:predicted RNA-binding Zn ribbon-like protein